jgi:hypothetical protein
MTLFFNVDSVADHNAHMMATLPGTLILVELEAALRHRADAVHMRPIEVATVLNGAKYEILARLHQASVSDARRGRLYMGYGHIGASVGRVQMGIKVSAPVLFAQRCSAIEVRILTAIMDIINLGKWLYMSLPAG